MFYFGTRRRVIVHPNTSADLFSPLPEKAPLYPMCRRLGLAHRRARTLWSREFSCPRLESKPGHLACCCTPNELSWLLRPHGYRLKVVFTFGSNYICERAFSTEGCLKYGYRSSLTDRFSSSRISIGCYCLKYRYAYSCGWGVHEVA
jgi:hypothetical protein